jgi:hypothetical protein
MIERSKWTAQQRLQLLDLGIVLKLITAGESIHVWNPPR